MVQGVVLGGLAYIVFGGLAYIKFFSFISLLSSENSI